MYQKAADDSLKKMDPEARRMQKNLNTMYKKKLVNLVTEV
jgi:hypothetical protein